MYSLDMHQACNVEPNAHSLPMNSSPTIELPVPGKPVVKPHSRESLEILDNAEEWGAFSKANAENPCLWESSVVIEGMHCAACSITVEDALRRVPGVVSARVSAASQRAQVQWSDQTAKPSDWMQAVQDVGYRAVPANDLFILERRRQETRQALWRWLVAGFCMMQVMMYAYPAYIAQEGDLTSEMEQLLRWASWVLSLPVVLFSCGPFFRNAWRDLRLGQVSMDLPVALGIVITFVVSTVGTFEPQGIFGREVYFDSMTMFVFFLLTGRWLELRLRDRTAGALEALMNRLPDHVERQRTDGSYEWVAARRVLVGDLLRVAPGQTFAADGVLEGGQTLVDEALLTGESKPVKRMQGEDLIAGSHNLSATVLLRVKRVGRDTRFAQIVALMESASASKPQLALLADRLAKPFLIFVLLAAGLSCMWWWPTNPEHALMVAVAVLVVTCPCALSLATPTALLAAAGNLARAGVLVSNLAAFESLSRVDTLVFDKTGTLTKDAMAITAIRVREGTTAQDALACAAALAAYSLHPVSRALLLAAQQDPTVSADATRWQCVATEEFAGKGLEGRVNGDVMRLGSASFCEVSDMQGGREVFLSDKAGWMATFSLQEDLRFQAAQAVYALQQMGITVHMLSGDNLASVNAVAAKAGITSSRGNCAPDDKLQFMRELQSQGKQVAMVGDGLNDGPVLAGAHVSFAFGNAVPLAQARSDFVVLGSDLLAVPDAFVLARKTMRIVRQNLGWALFYNAACVPLAVLGYLPAWLAGLGMASSSLWVVLNALRLALPSSRRSNLTGMES